MGDAARELLGAPRTAFFQPRNAIAGPAMRLPRGRS